MSTRKEDLTHSQSQDTSTEGLAARVQRLEDERQILQLIDLHSFLSDAGPAEGFAELYDEDCVVDYGEVVAPGSRTIVEGRDRLLKEFYLIPSNRDAKGRSQHFRCGPQAIQIVGDKAWGVTYVMVTYLVDGEAKILVSGFNFWTLNKGSGRWRIARRALRRLGDSDVLELFKPVVEQAFDRLADAT
jgi:hypothetical protein